MQAFHEKRLTGYGKTMGTVAGCVEALGEDGLLLSDKEIGDDERRRSDRVRRGDGAVTTATIDYVLKDSSFILYLGYKFLNFRTAIRGGRLLTGDKPEAD
jgi:hypothetical protein